MLKKIAGIKPSFESRVTNEAVRNVFGAPALSHTLLQCQLKFLGKIASQGDNSILRTLVFKDSCFELRPLRGRRRRGRPRNAWAPELFAIAKRIATTSSTLDTLWANSVTTRESWKRAVAQFCTNLA